MPVVQKLKAKLFGQNSHDRKTVPATGNGNCGFNALAIDIIANANHPKLKRAIKAAPIWNRLINYLYEAAGLTRTKHDPYEALQDYLNNVTGLRQREAQLATALRKLYTEDLFSLVPMKDMQNYFMVAAKEYFAKQRGILPGDRFKGDDTFTQIPAIKNYIIQFYQDHHTQMPQPGVAMTVYQDTFATELDNQLMQFWQTQGHELYHAYSAQEGSLTNDFELNLLAQQLQLNLSVKVHNNPRPISMVIEKVGPKLYLESVPGHWDASVTNDQYKKLNTTIPATTVNTTPAPRIEPAAKNPVNSDILPSAPELSNQRVRSRVVNDQVDQFFDQLDELSKTGKIDDLQKETIFNQFFEKSTKVYIAMDQAPTNEYRFKLFNQYHSACSKLPVASNVTDQTKTLADTLTDAIDNIKLVK